MFSKAKMANWLTSLQNCRKTTSIVCRIWSCKELAYLALWSANSKQKWSRYGCSKNSWASNSSIMSPFCQEVVSLPMQSVRLRTSCHNSKMTRCFWRKSRNLLCIAMMNSKRKCCSRSPSYPSWRNLNISSEQANKWQKYPTIWLQLPYWQPIFSSTDHS